MASKALNSPLIQYVVKRGFAQACPAAKELRLETKTLANNTLVTALDNGSPITQITVAFKAGSRYEPATDLGAAHIIRSAAGLTTGASSGFITTRKIAQLGGAINASGDREMIYYTLETTQDHVEEAVQCLINMISQQEFRPWEISDISSRLKYDIASLSPQVRAVDLLHKAAYRRGLGNSLWIAPRRVGSISTETLQHYAAAHIAPARAAVSVIGDSLDRAAHIAQSLKLGNVSANPTNEPSKYYGGELRKEIGGELAHIALAAQGAPAGSKDALALAVAAKALGSGPVTKWGADNSLLGRQMGNIGPYAAAGFSVAYTDSGLFGVVLSVPKDEAKVAVTTALSVMKNTKLNDIAVISGKNQLKLALLSEADSGSVLSESLAAQGLSTGNVKTPSMLAAEIDQLSTSDISQAVSKAVQSGLSMGAVGNLAFTPYINEL